MGLMTHLRDRGAIILFVLLVLFLLSMAVGGLVGGANIMDIITGKHPNAVGVVNGVEITLREYEAAVAREMQAYREKTGSDIPESQTDFIRNQVWESFIRDILIQETIQKKGIQAKDEEIIYRLFNAPPEILKSNPAFQNEQKQFDMAKYQAVLHDPTYKDQWKPIEDYLRQTLPYEKFQQMLSATVRVTDDEIKREYLKQNQTATVKYILIDPNRFKDDKIEVTESMMEDYYKSHKDEFKQQEKRQIQYVIFSTSPTAEDSAEVKDLANRLVKRLRSGEEFSELAEIYSEDPGSKNKGGDLGYFGRGTMVKPFEDAAFSAKLGEIVGPIKSQYGLHIIKVEDKKIENGKEQVKAKHILLKFEPSRETLNNARDRAEYMAERAKEQPMAELATQSGDSVQTTGFFVQGNGFIPGIGLNKSASNFIFSHKVGEIGPVIETNQGYMTFKISGIQKEHIQPFDEVDNLIENKIRQEKRMEKAQQMAEQIYNDIQNGLSFEDAAAADSLSIQESSPFKRSGFVSGVGREPSFIGTAFALKKGEVSKPVKATRGVYLIQLKEKSGFNEADFQTKKTQIAQQLLQKRQNEVFSNWYAYAKERADIKDYRDRFYN